MRLRNKPWADELFLAHEDLCCPNPEDFKGKWEERFEKNQPIHIEVGSGKGRFLYEMAKAHPEINYIAVEMQKNALISALEMMIASPVNNLQLLVADGGKITNYFQKAEVSQLYLNFSDPWPKKKHEKRRLTFHTFLDQYQEILIPQGEIHFKTDNQGLFEYSLSSLSKNGWILKQVWLDLHHSDYLGNIMTEYEEKFSQRGDRIYRLEAYYPVKKED